MVTCSSCSAEIAPAGAVKVRGKVCCKKCLPDVKEAYRRHVTELAMKVLVSTTEQLEGHRIVSYLGPVSVAAMSRLNAFADTVGDLWDVLGIADHDERRLIFLHEQAVRRLQFAAADRGAHAVVATRFDSEYVESTDSRGVFETRDRKMMVTAVGTAVLVERITRG